MSIPDSALMSRQGSRSDSRVSLSQAGVVVAGGGLAHHQRIPSGLSVSPVQQQQQHQQQSLTPSPVQQQHQQETILGQQQQQLRATSPSASPVSPGSPYLQQQQQQQQQQQPAPAQQGPQRLTPMLPRQESSFTTEEINR